MKIGIDLISFSTSKYFLSLETLARHRHVDSRKYTVGIGQVKMSVFPPNEDIVTIALDAAQKVMARVKNKNDIDILIFATESSFDLSKSAGIYVHHFLKLKEECRVFDIKQACYSAVAALQLAKSYIVNNPNSKVLVVGSDIIKYSPNTSGEPTQGGAAVAFIIAQAPRILEIEPHSGIHTVDVMDFWRPHYLDEALFDGKLSAYNYLKSLDICVDGYLKKASLLISDIDHLCFHAPFGKIAQKANDKRFQCKSFGETLKYNSVIGNSCSASLFICLVSLLDHAKNDLSHKRIGFFSYGSGSVSEFFSGVISENYKEMLDTSDNQKMLSNRIEITFSEYESLYNAELHRYKNVGNITMSAVVNHQRIYKQL
jgi:hydroxymethylglutaryl-CoA synthase